MSMFLTQITPAMDRASRFEVGVASELEKFTDSQGIVMLAIGLAVILAAALITLLTENKAHTGAKILASIEKTIKEKEDS